MSSNASSPRRRSRPAPSSRADHHVDRQLRRPPSAGRELGRAHAAGRRVPRRRRGQLRRRPDPVAAGAALRHRAVARTGAVLSDLRVRRPLPRTHRALVRAAGRAARSDVPRHGAHHQPLGAAVPRGQVGRRPAARHLRRCLRHPPGARRQPWHRLTGLLHVRPAGPAAWSPPDRPAAGQRARSVRPGLPAAQVRQPGDVDGPAAPLRAASHRSARHERGRRDPSRTAARRPRRGRRHRAHLPPRSAAGE